MGDAFRSASPIPTFLENDVDYYMDDFAAIGAAFKAETDQVSISQVADVALNKEPPLLVIGDLVLLS